MSALASQFVRTANKKRPTLHVDYLAPIDRTVCKVLNRSRKPDEKGVRMAWLLLAARSPRAR